MIRMEVYLDNSATTRCSDSAARKMKSILCEEYGNPSSMHRKGVQAEGHLRYASGVIARNLKVNEKEIYFTSGGTESNNLAIIGTAMANRRAGTHLITTAIEHPAVAWPMKYLESQGFEVTRLGVDEKGVICLEELIQALRKDTILVSIMHTNNEVGSLQPVEEAGRLIKNHNPSTLFHVDAVQGYGKWRILPKKIGIDLLSVSGHKIHGPKGIGFLYVNEKVKILPIMYGGGQQRGLRSGTENVPAIAGMAAAIEENYRELEADTAGMRYLKAHFVAGMQQMEGIRFNGSVGQDSAPHIISMAVKGVRSEVLLHALEDQGIYVSAGSACSSNRPSQSETLKAMGIGKEWIGSTLRFSLSRFTTAEEIDYTLETLYDIIPMLRKYTRH